MTVYAAFMEEIKVKTLNSAAAGPHAVIFGAVHGNEVAGPRAIARLLPGLHLIRGRVTFVPVANPLAHARGVRFVDVNLNRVFDEDAADAGTYEGRLAARLMPIMREADVFLDLHSTLKPAPPFAVVGRDDPATLALARAVGTAEVVAETFHAKHPYNLSFLYAARHGASSILVECGQHEDPASVDVAERAVRSVLALHGMTQGAPQPVAPGPQALLTVRDVFYVEEVASYAGCQGHPPHGALYPAGTPIAQMRDGRVLSYDHDVCLLFANNGAADGRPPEAEMFYVATRAGA